MNCSTPAKFDYARRLAAALSYIALADMDRVSILAYADDIKDVLPLTRGKDRILTVLRFLERLDVSGSSTCLHHVAKRSCIGATIWIGGDN